jgi:hypothetical protein
VEPEGSGANLRRETLHFSEEKRGGRPKMPWASEEARLSVRKHSECPKTLGECPKALGECPKALVSVRRRSVSIRRYSGEHPEMLGGGFRCGLENRGSPCTVSKVASPERLHRFRASPVNARKRSVKPSDRRHTKMPVRSFRVPVTGCLVRPFELPRKLECFRSLPGRAACRTS